jgi:hypothetical protein
MVIGYQLSEVGSRFQTSHQWMSRRAGNRYGIPVLENAVAGAPVLPMEPPPITDNQ